MKHCNHKREPKRFKHTDGTTVNVVIETGKTRKSKGRGHRRKMRGSHMTKTDENMRHGSRRGHRHGRGHGKRHGGRRRPLGHGELKFVLLGMIGKAPSHGYDLIAGIETLTSGAYVPSPGTIYPTLDVMQDLGWITAEEVDGKRVMNITEAGKTAAAENEQVIADANHRLETLTGKREDDQPGHPRNDMRRLAHTVKSAMREGGADAEVISAILAEAREKIEKL